MGIISIGSVVLSSSSIKCQGLVAPAEGLTEYRFIGGGIQANYNPVLGENFSFQAILSTNEAGAVLQGSYTWADILALRDLPNYPQEIQHPKITELGLGGLTAIIHKVDLNNLVQYNGTRGEYIDPNSTFTYPGTEELLRWYGAISFTRMT